MLKNILSLITLILFNFCFAINHGFAYDFSQNDVSIFEKSFQYVNKKKFDKAISTSKKSSDPLVEEVIRWMVYQRPYSNSSYAEVANFIKHNPNWPKTRLLRNVAEQSLDLKTPASAILTFFENNEPITGQAMFLLARARLANIEDIGGVDALIKKAWIQGDFDYEVELEILKNYSNYLTNKEHVKRVDRLLWEGKVSNAKRILKYVDRNHEKLFIARISLIEGRRGVDKAIKRIPKSLRNDAGFVFDRIKWHQQRRNYHRVYEYIKNARKTMPHQDEWWKIKNYLVREFIDEKKYKKAYELAKYHGNVSSGDYAEAEWLAGWLALRFLKNPHDAYKHFYNMYNKVSFPVSRARGAYWAGRAAEQNKNSEIANGWYKIASAHPTTFYGQLAYLKVSDNKNISMPQTPKISSSDVNKYKKNKMLGAAYLFSKVNREKTSERFIIAAIGAAKNKEQMAVIADFGFKIGRKDLSVIASKHALRKGVVLSDYGWPTVDYKPNMGLEKPLMLSIVRQESRFNPNAKSSANAMGMMQILPSTAKQTARRAKVKYRKSYLLQKPEYNMLLGSTYLNQLVDSKGGSYVLAIAAYNAGPTNAKRWAKKYGDPKEFSNPEQVIDWIESLPFSETRNYVQRVLENLQVYRIKYGAKSFSLNQDLLRSDVKISKR